MKLLKVNNRALGGLLLTFALLAAGPLQAQETAQGGAETRPGGTGDTAEGSAVEQLEQLLQQTSSYRARVEQLLVDQDGRELQEASARLIMRKPSHFYWEVTSPYEEVMVTDGEVIWRYEPDLEQVVIQEFDAELDRTPLMLLNGNAAAIADTFDVSRVGTVESVDTGELEIKRFVLRPRQPDSLFERMAVTFRGAELVEMQVEDSLGQQTSLSFHDIERNIQVPDERFRFTPPEGVEIIDTTEE